MFHVKTNLGMKSGQRGNKKDKKNAEPAMLTQD